MERHWKLHECDKIPKEGVEILYSMDNCLRQEKTWRMFIRRTATTEDLEGNHILEEEGEIIWETSIEIAHCPYCGEQLIDWKQNKLKDYGQFELTDFSAWKSRRM